MADRPNDETWYSRALPILQAVREVEGTDEAHAIPIGALAERLSLDPGHVAVEVERLIEGGYLSEKLVKPMGGRDVRPGASATLGSLPPRLGEIGETGSRR